MVLHPDDVVLPVLVDVGEPTRSALVAHVETTLGWQVVDGDHAVVRLRDVRSRPGGELPTVLVLTADDAPDHVAACVGVDDGAVAWPDDHGRLATVVRDLVGRRRPSGTVPLVVGGASGGVGTTTVAMALAGLRGWAGHPTLVVTRGPLVTPEVLDIDEELLDVAALCTSAPTVPGVPDLHVARLDRPWRPRPRVGVRAGVVVDAGVADEVDVLVLRRDRPGVDALARSPAAAAVVLDAGVAPRRAVLAAAAGRPVVPVATSVRVARAHAARRLPSALPGRWLSTLAPLAGTD